MRTVLRFLFGNWFARSYLSSCRGFSQDHLEHAVDRVLDEERQPPELTRLTM